MVSHSERRFPTADVCLCSYETATKQRKDHDLNAFVASEISGTKCQLELVTEIWNIKRGKGRNKRDLKNEKKQANK
jgi:hypothetical protein